MLAIVFADVAQSTRLFETYGDIKARQVIAEALDAMAEITERCKGQVIKTIGDEIMCTLPDADLAVQATSEMQKAISQNPNLIRMNIAIRIGFHYGEVIMEANDVFGDAVNVAHRMVEVAKADEIITNRETVDRFSQEWQMSTRRLGDVKVKGKQNDIEVYEVVWQEDFSNLTLEPDQISQFQQNVKASLILHFRDQEFRMDDDMPTLRIGRITDNDLVVEQALVSRYHAVIELRRGKFFLKDQSRNGIGLKPDQGVEIFIHREEIPLHGQGAISLGQAVSKNEQGLILYKLV